MIDLDDYYLGVITVDPSYFNNPKRYRMINDVNYDPFSDLSFAEALIKGVPTLLRKNGEVYYDEYNSRWKNELKYSLGVSNDLGIVLSFVKPFKDYFEEEPVVYIKEEVESDYELMEEIFHNHFYYIARSKLDRSEAIVVVDEGMMYDFHYDYYEYLLGQFDGKSKSKKMDD